MAASRHAGPDAAPRFAMVPSHVAGMPIASTPPVVPVVDPHVADRAQGGTAAAQAAVPITPRTQPERRPVPATERRTATDSKRPYHVGVALGLTASIYAGSLAAVSMLQFEHDRSLIADRQPVSDAIALLGQHHDAMTDDLERAGVVFEDASLRYEALATGLQALHADVVALSDTLARVNKLAAIDASGLGPGVRRGGSSLPAVGEVGAESQGQGRPAVDERHDRGVGRPVDPIGRNAGDPALAARRPDEHAGSEERRSPCDTRCRDGSPGLHDDPA